MWLKAVAVVGSPFHPFDPHKELWVGDLFLWKQPQGSELNKASSHIVYFTTATKAKWSGISCQSSLIRSCVSLIRWPGTSTNLFCALCQTRRRPCVLRDCGFSHSNQSRLNASFHNSIIAGVLELNLFVYLSMYYYGDSGIVGAGRVPSIPSNGAARCHPLIFSHPPSPIM